MNILDIKRLIDVERYRKINVDARRPEDVYPDARAMAPEETWISCWSARASPRSISSSATRDASMPGSDQAR